MSCGLKTGKRITNPPRKKDDCDEVTYFDDVNPREDVIYPSSDLRYIVVEPGKVVIITAYNLNSLATQKVDIARVLFSRGEDPAGVCNGCCKTYQIGRSVELARVVIPQFALTPDRPMVALFSMGVYALEIIMPIPHMPILRSVPPSFSPSGKEPDSEDGEDDYIPPTGEYGSLLITASSYPIQAINTGIF